MRLRRRAVLAALAGLISVVIVGAAGAADPAFSPGGPLPGGDNPASLAIADLNGDGKPDLAVANNRSDDITVLLGDGAGRFNAAPGSPLKAGDGPYAVATADLNGDGKTDLAVTNNWSNSLTIYLNDGAGGFSPAPGSPVAVGGSPEDIEAADVNGDGNVDLALPVHQNAWQAVVLLGDGTGRFAPAPGSPVSVGDRSGSAAIAAADLNGDGKSDLAVARSESRVLSILPGDGAGRFGAARTVAAGYGPSSLAVADLNRDGKPDLAVGSIYSDGGRAQNKLVVMLGNGSGGFSRAAGSPIALSGMPVSVAVADLNADARPDIAVATSHPEPNGITVLMGTGTGRFRPAVDSPFAISRPTEVAASDLNGDGESDLAVASLDGVRILFRTASTPAIVRGRTLRGPSTVYSTTGLITKLAADANRVAVKSAAGRNRRCGPVIVWTAPSRKSKSYPISGCISILCRPYTGCVDELALGAGQVAWIARSGGNNLELILHAARLAGGGSKRIAYASNGNGAGGSVLGQWLGHLMGAGPVLAYNTWDVRCTDDPNDDDGCSATHVANEKLLRTTGGRRVVVRRGQGSRPLSAVGGGRMAVESGGAVTVLAASGAPLATIPAMESDPPRAIALSSASLAVMRTFSLDLYNAANGNKVKSIPLGPAAALQLTGLNSSVALLRGPRRLVLLRLRDGKAIALPLPAAAATNLVDARLTSAGLFYAYNAPRATAKGRIVFEPTARVLARF